MNHQTCFKRVGSKKQMGWCFLQLSLEIVNCHYDILHVHHCKSTLCTKYLRFSVNLLMLRLPPRLQITILAHTLHITSSSFKVVCPSGVSAGNGISSRSAPS